MFAGLPEELGAELLAFGDLFLEDIREYRESRLEGTGFTPIFPVWGLPTPELAQEMIASGSTRNHHRVEPHHVARKFRRSLV